MIINYSRSTYIKDEVRNDLNTQNIQMIVYDHNGFGNILTLKFQEKLEYNSNVLNLTFTSESQANPTSPWTHK